MFYVYILKSIENGVYYVGSCENIQKRIKQHNSGLIEYTKKYLPWELIYYEELPNLSEARVREKQIKGWKKRSAIERLIKHF